MFLRFDRRILYLLLCNIYIIQIYIIQNVRLLLFNHIILSNKNGRFQQFPQTLNVGRGHWKFQAPTRCQKTERPRRSRTEKESAMFSNQDIKGSIFPEGRTKPLKGGQLLAAQFNQKIKHRGLSLTPYIESNLEIITAVSSLDPLFPKRVSANSHQVEGQIIFPRNSLRGNEENCSRKVSPFFCSYANLANSRIHNSSVFRFVNSASKIRAIGPDCEKSN